MEKSKSHPIAGYLFAFGIACIPLVQNHSIADPTLLSRQVYLAILLLVTLCLISFNKAKTSFQIPGLFIGCSLLWLLSALLSLQYAYNTAEAWYSISKIVLSISSIYTVYILLNSGTASMKEISIGIVAASALSSLMLAIELQENWEAGTRLWDQKNLYALQTAFGHKNLYASFQLLCLPGIAYLYLHSGNRVRIIAASVFILALASIGLIQTKSVIIGILLALIFIMPIASSLLYKNKRRSLYFALGLYVFGLSGFLFMIYLYPQKFTLLLNNDTIRERILLWQNTKQMILEFFPFGTGAGNWQVYFPKYGLGEFMKTNYLISDGYTTFQRPHNDFLWVLSELGLMGLIAYSGIFFFAIYAGIKKAKQLESRIEIMGLLGFLTGLFAYLFVAFTDFPLERNEHQFILAIILSFLIGSSPHKTIQNAKLGKGWLLLTGILLLLSLTYSIKRMPNEQHAKKIIQAQINGNWMLILKEAKRIQPSLYNLDNFSIPIAWYEGLAHYSLNNHSAAKTSFTEAYRLNPYQVHVLNNMAGMVEQEGNHAEALKYYNELLKISPKQPDAILNKSAVLFNEGKMEEAMACIYLFKYDEKNDQFLQFLQAIGKSYLTLKIEKEFPNKKAYYLEKLNEPDFIQSYFKYNKEQNHSFEDLTWPPEIKQ